MTCIYNLQWIAFYLKSIFYRSRKPAQYHFFYHACIWNTLQFYIHVHTNNRYINRWSMISVLFCRIIYLLNINVSRLHSIYKSDLVSMFILKYLCCSPLYEDWAETKKKQILQQYINNGGVVELGQIAHSQQLQTGAESAGHVVISRLQFARISHISWSVLQRCLNDNSSWNNVLFFFSVKNPSCFWRVELLSIL